MYLFYIYIFFSLFLQSDGLMQITIPTKLLRNRKLMVPLVDVCFYKKSRTDPYYYGSTERKRYKKLLGIHNLVQDHHIIPKQWRSHKLLTHLCFDINNSDNIIAMPNKLAVNKLTLGSNQVIHDGGHLPYNIYVKEQLDNIFENNILDDDSIEYSFYLFHHHLKKNMYFNEDNIPWR